MEQIGQMVGQVLYNIHSDIKEDISSVRQFVQEGNTALRSDISDVKGDISDTRKQLRTEMKSKHKEIINEVKLATNIAEFEITLSDPLLSKHYKMLVEYLYLDEDIFIRH
jgi:hypothetical protein